MSIDFNSHLEKNHAGARSAYIKSIVYGGLDGLITTFSIMSAAFAISLDPDIIISLAVASLIADGLSMGLGDYISSKFEIRYILSEKRKEEHEYDVNREYEVEELIELYENTGLCRDDAEKIVTVYSSKPEYKNLFIKQMVLLELDLMIPENESPMLNGFITFLSFIIFGSVPIIFYVIVYTLNYNYYNVIFGINCAVTALTIFILGICQALITKQSILYSGFIMTLNGVIASASAYFIGYGIEELF